MSILVLNLGSTSFKFELFDERSLESLEKGEFEMPADSAGKDAVKQEEVDKTFREMLRKIGDVSLIKAVGHRIVHGGDKYLATTLIDTQEIFELENLNSLAPLHNPYNLAGIKASNKYIPDTPDYAVFDTTFFVNLPEFAKVYPIPYEYYTEKNIHKFGFHGISHKYAAEQAAKKLKMPLDKVNLLTVHLGGGASVTAIAKGSPIDTSMGLTPLEGLMMMTRSGDVGEGVMLEIFKDVLAQETDPQKAIEKLRLVLNNESGIKGICDHDNYLDLLKAVDYGDSRSQLALDMFIHRIRKYIGAYMLTLGEVHALVFTGKIGAGKAVTRKKICDKIKLLANVEKIVVKPHEELAIASEIKNLL